MDVEKMTKEYDLMVKQIAEEREMEKFLTKNGIDLPPFYEELAKIATDLKFDSEKMDILERICVYEDDYGDYNNSDDEIEKYNDAFGGGGHDYYYH